MPGEGTDRGAEKQMRGCCAHCLALLDQLSPQKVGDSLLAALETHPRLPDCLAAALGTEQEAEVQEVVLKLLDAALAGAEPSQREGFAGCEDLVAQVEQLAANAEDDVVHALAAGVLDLLG